MEVVIYANTGQMFKTTAQVESKQEFYDRFYSANNDNFLLIGDVIIPKNKINVITFKNE